MLATYLNCSTHSTTMLTDINIVEILHRETFTTSTRPFDVWIVENKF